jgi:hypothetical protein
MGPLLASVAAIAQPISNHLVYYFGWWFFKNISQWEGLHHIFWKIKHV